MHLRHLAVLALAVAAPGARAVDLNVITAVDVKDEGASVVVSVTGSRKPSFTTFSMADPPRFVIDFSEARFEGVPEDVVGRDGLIQVVKNVSYGSGATSIARVMIAFTAEVAPPVVEDQGTTLRIRMERPGGAAAVAQAAGAAPSAAKADAERRAREEADAKARAEAQASAEAERRAREEADVKARAEAQASAEAERRAREEADVKARAEAQARAEAERHAGEEADAKARAEAQARTDAAAKTAEEARVAERARAEARALEERAHTPAAAQAAAPQAAAPPAGGSDEPVGVLPPPVTIPAEPPAAARHEAAPAPAAQEPTAHAATPEERPHARGHTARASLREVGFKQMGGVSRVFVRTSAPPRFTVQDIGENLIRVELENTRVERRNDLRGLDTSYFPSAVARVTPSRHGTTYVLDIRLRQRVAYQQKVEGDVLALDFEGPALRPSGAAPAPAADAAEPGPAPSAEPAPVEPAR